VICYALQNAFASEPLKNYKTFLSSVTAALSSLPRDRAPLMLKIRGLNRRGDVRPLHVRCHRQSAAAGRLGASHLSPDRLSGQSSADLGSYSPRRPDEVHLQRQRVLGRPGVALSGARHYLIAISARAPAVR